MTLQATRDLLEGEKIFAVAAVVQVHKGEESHWDVREGKLIVSVVTLRHHVEVDAIMPGGGDDKSGVWMIPPVGTEVIVNFDDGHFDGDGYIVGVHGTSPTGLLPGKLLIIGDQIEARSDGGTARSLAFKDELVAVDQKYAEHVHGVPGTFDIFDVPYTGPASALAPHPHSGTTLPPGSLIPVPLDNVTIEGTDKFKAE